MPRFIPSRGDLQRSLFPGLLLGNLKIPQRFFSEHCSKPFDPGLGAPTGSFRMADRREIGARSVNECPKNELTLISSEVNSIVRSLVRNNPYEHSNQESKMNAQ